MTHFFPLVVSCSQIPGQCLYVLGVLYSCPSIPDKGNGLFSTAYNRLWGSPIVLSNWYRGQSSRGLVVTYPSRYNLALP
jgi:hypothetical protein